MKNLLLISFVGVDSNTNWNELSSFDKSCEFSVLFSKSKSDKRYPNYQFCQDFLNWSKKHTVTASVHLCGEEAINGYLNQEEQIMMLCEQAYRTQLNFNIKKYPSYDELSEKIISTAQTFNHRIILQQNQTKAKFLEHFLNKFSSNTERCEVHLLHDSSGGFGREINSVVPPNKEYFTGYAGGINPGNVSKIINLIESVNVEKQPYYIDMESGIRIDNIFSIEKCRNIIKEIYNDR